MTAPAQPTILERVLRFALIVLVFALVGPPVGAVIFMLLVALVGFGWTPDASGSMFVIAAFALIYAVPLSYVMGLAPAVLAGALVALWLAFFGRMGWLFALLTGLAVGVAAELVFGQAAALREGDGVPPMLGVTCGLATLICWLIVRRWSLPSILSARAGAIL
jgi:hypothetical protein